MRKNIQFVVLLKIFTSLQFVTRIISAFGILVFFIFSVSIDAKTKNTSEKRARKSARVHQTIVLSIDGFPAYYLSDSKYQAYFPHLSEIFQKYGVSEINTINPSVTYPAHTSMVTGKDPAEHGIYNNTLSDPFEKNDGGWMWYTEDIVSPTLWDLAKENHKTTANVFWPVTVGAHINWNLPQYWRKKIPEDDKLLRVLSTKDLHKEAELAVGSPLNDVSKDEVKLKTATWLFQNKKPDLMFVYTTDLDTNHHGFGPGSDKALKRLSELDKAIFEFLQSVGAFTPKGPGLVIVSDHGFHSAESVCAPNVVLKQKGYIQDEAGTYQLTFKSSGGTAILLPGTRAEISVEELNSIVSEILTACPGSEWIPTSANGMLSDTSFSPEDEISSIQKKIHPKALGLFRTKQSMFFSGTRKGDVFTKSQTKIHGHGYWNENPEMKTIGFVYDPTGKKHEFLSVKDVFGIVKDMLGLNEKKNKGIRVSRKP
ncbi:ectonucleotide pyrophosphatase/phosphodiesterase [Leptospira sp. 2 VSF19]|uniref:Ectonucleotide pyrophosphatase/phosphodiesterase n=1 Tax=Leptospira soteropolitanensis TaxID=2950025 RepID=A0AAW5VIT3_9LEPT|nr:ectonucleotide pyrophosphatase/phosphodiesterase [Leptospira soteropolitanensis]MCW7492272.1 ectonucleotide pyrophosphatase/phosphodiesterase [Leptospira soteropolitanensis]MCW7499854.1 ectonucleotide pyrophosphatase/phosphodiesterase [Leptospira soteropolitanensis]MCW7522105.1 ectonucleotide pyrophosphatase/phosphodiesterase [Leptospira soteropolitanensis]MCW7525959.1 ectonucleotide pyrophosphatase/phosphodiesterase [Leptospira soteropolitanensis]MCW7529927.1 ectonucleotide pyrophosphatase